MPKIKTNRGAVKRFKQTGSGGFKHRSSNRNHINTKMSGKQVRSLRGMSQVDAVDVPAVKQMLGK